MGFDYELLNVTIVNDILIYTGFRVYPNICGH